MTKQQRLEAKLSKLQDKQAQLLERLDKLNFEIARIEAKLVLHGG